MEQANEAVSVGIGVEVNCHVITDASGHIAGYRITPCPGGKVFEFGTFNGKPIRGDEAGA